jgi:predicted TIM-barrel fold metal-dependent hydrolase
VPNRRDSIRGLAGTTAGLLAARGGLLGQVVYGTDLPALAWPDSVDTILAEQITNAAEKEAILGGNLTKLLKL